MHFNAGAVVAFLAATVVAAANNRTTLPALLGPYKVAISTHEVDTTRNDPLAPTKRKRRLMVTVYQPFTDCATVYTPFAPPKISNLLDSNSYQVDVPNGTFARLQLQNCRKPDFTGPAYVADTPLLLSSPGLEESTYYFGATNEAVASSGYTVVGLEHTWESPAVLFPDGEIAQPNLKNVSTPEEADRYYGRLVRIRSADATSVLDAIQAGKIPGLESFKRDNLTAGIYGHSLGGCTAVASIAADKRFTSGINFDGSIFGYVNNVTLTTPFFLMTGAEAPTSVFDSFWKQLKGWKLHVRVAKTAHEAFMDFPLIADTLGTRGSPPQSPDRIGSIKGVQIQKIMWAYTIAFFDYAVKGKQSELLQKPSSEYPQVHFIRQSEG